MERNSEDQTQGIPSSDWGLIGEYYDDYATTSERDRLRAARGAVERESIVHPIHHVPMTPQSSPEPSAEEARAGQLLNRLDASAHKLASADSAEILPLALDTFLSLCSAARGLALIWPEGAAACRVEVNRRMLEWADSFTREARFWEAAPGEAHLVQLARTVQDTAGDGASDPLMGRLADAGVQWYIWLPLAVQGRVEVVLIALGDGAAPTPPKSDLLLSALGVLGDLLGAMLEQARLRLLLNRKDAIRSEFLTLASHELKSPLTVIKGYSQLLLRQARRGGSSGVVDMGGLEVINQQVNRMSNLVAELLDASRIERGVLEVQLQPVELVGLVRHVVGQRQRVLPDAAFRLMAPESALMVLGDPARLEQVLGQLLDNAIRFGNEYGPVEVRVQRAAANTLPPALLATALERGESQPAAQGDMALVEVRDYGLGLPAAERPMLFTAFYRGPEQGVHRQLAGLGLGLYLSRYLMTRQHGYLWAEFPAAEGAPSSIFSFALPLLSIS